MSVRNFRLRILPRDLSRELLILVLIVLTALAVWAFVELADEVLEGEFARMDETLLLALRAPDDRTDPLGPEWVEELARDFSALGGTAILCTLTLAVVGFLALQGKPHAALFVLLAVGGGLLLSFLLKAGFGRPRPDLVPHTVYTYTASFPSGHAMMSAVTYLTLGALLARLQPLLRLRSYLLSVAVLLTLAVGLSRVYLGVHWPTDVLAGWTAGAAWALLCWIAVLLLQRRGKVESDVA